MGRPVPLVTPPGIQLPTHVLSSSFSEFANLLPCLRAQW